ncbi:hypothetical protein GCM10027273_31140 [Nocardioides pakistanensis]
MPNATAQSRNDHTIRDLTDVDQSRRARDIATKGTNRVSHTGTRAVLRGALPGGWGPAGPQGRASVYSLTHPEATLELLAAAERLLAAVGDAVTLCPRYGVEGGAR